MNKETELYLEKFSAEITDLFAQLRAVVFDCFCGSIEEKLWAKLPSYYNGENFVRLIPFKDHINIEAAGLAEFAGALSEYKFTPKGMMQISPKQAIPKEILKAAFEKTLTK